MQVDVVQIDPDWLGVGDPKMGPAAIILSTVRVMEAPSSHRLTSRYHLDETVVHVVAEELAYKDISGKKKLRAVCGQESNWGLAFQIHERAFAFRNSRWVSRDNGQKVAPPWHRLCRRCIGG